MLLLFLPKLSPRCEYIFKLIFKDEFQIDYRTTTDIAEFEHYSQEKINYSNSKISQEFFIKATPLLFENQIRKQHIQVAQKHGTKVIFPNNNDDIGFDIFAAAFYLISRYEEYLPFSPDQFGRFKAEDSLAFQNDFLSIPVINIWMNILKNSLKEKFPLIGIKSTAFNAIVTYDIDVAFKYNGRSIGRTFGSVLKDLWAFKIKDLHERINVLLRKQKDPWDTYHDLKKMILQNKLSSIFFFLLSDKSRHDRNLNYQKPIMKKLVNKVAMFSQIGIHPSFYSSTFPEKILIEKERLENLASAKITKSRQHYLKFSLPDTYISLVAAGITEDYSMGFPGKPGFRAGTCKPFYFYDLKNEKQIDLKIFPLTFMESTLNISLNPNEALEKIFLLLEEVKNVDGTFISLWHNHTISKTDDYKEWKNIHEKMIQKLSDYLQ
jgi:hypothetical protein